MKNAIIILSLLAFAAGAQAGSKDKQKNKKANQTQHQETEALDAEVMIKELDEDTNIIRIYDEDFNLVKEVKSDLLDVDMDTYYLISQSARLMDDGSVILYQLK